MLQTLQEAGYEQVGDTFKKLDAEDKARIESFRNTEFSKLLKYHRLKRLAQARAARRLESLNLYEPLPIQKEFHESKTRTRVLRGSNRGGKTLPAAVEVARALIGRDPSDKYPKKDGRWFAVGKDLDHVGQVMYRKLFRAGAFKIIRDEHTGAWRSFRPWLKSDLDRENEARPAPPLIPPRYVVHIAWENKKEGIPSHILLTTGWEISFYSSLGKPPQGSDIDGFWFDEEIVDEEWYPEMSARILDRKGRGIWSATPQAGTEQLFELHERAERDRTLKRKTVEEYLILLRDNPHIGEQEKKDFAESLSEDERAVRIEGEFAIQSFKVYPEFSMDVHGVDWFPIPADWTRYMVVDPGHVICAVLFGACPPPDIGNFVYLYDELYIRECSAFVFGERVRDKVIGQRFHAFIIDHHMGIHTELGAGSTVAQQYSEALRENRVQSETTGHGFVYASDAVIPGIYAVHEMLRVRQDGTPRLRVLRGMLPNFEYEIKRYNKVREKGMVTEKPNQRKNNHLMDTTRYLAMYDPRYVRPRKGAGRATGALAVLREKRRRRGESGPQVVNLGPGGSNV